MSYELKHITSSLHHQWLVELHNDPLVLRNITHPEVISIEQHMQWWHNSILNNPKQLRLLCTHNSELIGVVKFYDIDYHNKCCNLGADLHKSHRGKGHAKHMWSMMLDYAFKTLQLHRVGLTTASYNDIGIRVYSKLGFIKEGLNVESLFRDGKYYDQICMYMLNDVWFKQYA